jgi:hypothetical protein
MRIAERTATLKGLYDANSSSCGWMCDEVAFLLYSMVKFTRPEVVVQTGHLWGKSALMVLEAMTDGFITEQPIEADAWRADRDFSNFVTSRTPPVPASPRMVSIDIATPDDGVRWLQETYPGFEFITASSPAFFASPAAADLAAECAGKRVLVIVDGEHSYHSASADMEGVVLLNRPVIFLDDTRWIPHLAALARDFAGRHAYQVIEFPWYNGVCLLVPEVTA